VAEALPVHTISHYRLLAYTTEDAMVLIQVLVHPRVPQDTIKACLISYYTHVTS
jgi:hypothetical protein